MKFWRAEAGVEAAFERLHREDNSWEVELDFESPLLRLVRQDPKQAEAARRIAYSPVTVVSGRGGTGKTEVVTAALEQIEEKMKWKQEEERDERGDSLEDVTTEEEEEESGKDHTTRKTSIVLYATPTGKAASVIRKRIGKEAHTIHKVKILFFCVCVFYTHKVV